MTFNFFANDSLIYNNTFLEEVDNLKTLIRKYEKVVSESVNIIKFSLLFNANTSLNLINQIQSSLNMSALDEFMSILVCRH